MIPGNDDAIRSIKLFTGKIADAALEGAARYRASGAADRDAQEERRRHEGRGGQREHLFRHQRRHRNLNPVRAGTLMTTNVATGQGLPLPQRARDALPRSLFGLAIASGSPICGIAQHAPNCGSFPTALPRPRRDLPIIQHASDSVDAESLLGIGLKHHPHHLGLGLHYLVECCRGVALLHVSVAERRSGKHVHAAVLRHVLLAPPAPFGDLGAFVFGDYALKLHQKLILRGGSRRRLQKNQLHSAARQFLAQQDLIGVLSAQPIRRVDQHRGDLALRGQIAQGL